MSASFLKRVLDLFGSSAALGVAAPVMLAAGVAIRLTMGRPVFFRQTRVGKGGKLFDFLKFRSMKVNAVPVSEMGQVGSDHPMVTKTGKILRRFKIDELPQLLSVIGGQASLVGPRPTVPEQVEVYDSFQSRRLAVRPGLTGWAQVNGNTNLSWEDRIRLDVWYIDHWSLGLDLRILLETVSVILLGEKIRQDRLEEARRHESNAGWRGR